MNAHPSLPFSGNTPMSRQNSALAAIAAAETRATKSRQLLELFREAGDMGLTDKQIERLTGWITGTVLSTRNGLVKAGLVEARSDARAVSEYARPITIWRRRQG